MSQRLIAAALALSALTASGAELLDAHRVDAQGVPVDWMLRVNRSPARLTAADDGATRGVCLDSDRASFSIQRAVDVDPRAQPRFAWRWRADVLPRNGDFRVDARDDQAAQLFVVFGRRAINYIWDTTAPTGATGNYVVPFLMTIKTVVVASGPANVKTWIDMERDVRQDFVRLFGEEPPRVTGIRFQVNSQHTGTKARGCIASVRFVD